MVRRTSRARERPGPDVLERMHEERRSGQAQPLPTRSPLPTDAEELPSLPRVVRDLLEAGCAAWGIALDERMAAALDVHARLLLAWTTAINLTSVRQPDRLAVLHLLDSLSAVPLLRRALGPRPRLADIGSGAGYPGLPLAIVLPAAIGVLIESVGKKARFLDVAAAAVLRAMGPDGPPPRLEVEPRRAEALVGVDGRRGAFDVVTVRAVGSLARLAALGLPLLRPGGLLVAWKSDDGRGALQAEVRAARATIAALGAAPARVTRLPAGVDGLDGHRLVVVRAGTPRPPAKGRTRLLG